MRRTPILIVVGVLLLSGLGVALAQRSDRSATADLPTQNTPAGRVPGPPDTDPGTIPPETPPETPKSLPSKGPSAAPTPHGQSLSPDEPVPDQFTPQPKLVQPRAGMENLRRTGWDRAEILGDKKVRLHFISGVEPCTVLDRVEVAQGDGRLVITLFEGNDPAARDAACIMIAQFKAVDVTLNEAVGGRTIVDGAD